MVMWLSWMIKEEEYFERYCNSAWAFAEICFKIFKIISYSHKHFYVWLGVIVL